MKAKKNTGTLYLIPTKLGTSSYERVFPEYNRNIILSLKNFIVEDIRSARRFLKSIKYPGNFDDVLFNDLNKHTKEEETYSYLKPLNNSSNIGLMSEAGVPCLADPGNGIVRQAHELGYKVVPLIGPSSILLALIASGFNGQNFSFWAICRLNQMNETENLKKLKAMPEKQGKQKFSLKRLIETNNCSMRSLQTADPKPCCVSLLTLPSKQN